MAKKHQEPGNIPRQAGYYGRELYDVGHRASAALEQIMSRQVLPEDHAALREDAAAVELGALELIAAGQRALRVSAEMKGYAEAFSHFDLGAS